MTDFKIDKGIPLPPPHSSHNGRFPFPEMEVGDSFVGNEVAANAAYQWGKSHNKKFVTRRVNEGGGYRIWRTK